MTKSHLICIDRQTWWSWQHFILNQTFTKLGQQLGLVWHHILVRWSYTKIRTNTSRLRHRPKIWPKTKRPRACKHRAAHSRPVWYYMGGQRKDPAHWGEQVPPTCGCKTNWSELPPTTVENLWWFSLQIMFEHRPSWPTLSHKRAADMHLHVPVGWPNQLAWASSS